MSSFDIIHGFECDHCGQTVGGDPYDFNESLDLRKQEGWINRKIDGEWFSFCCQSCYDEWLIDMGIKVSPKRICHH